MELEAELATCVIKGTCQTMCPAAEIHLRERERLLHYLEISKHEKTKAGRPAADWERTVKQFSRPAAGRIEASPADIRPYPVLLRTVNYLLGEVAVRTEGDWVQIYDFVFDRLRAVRQDAVLQALRGPQLIPLLERIVRFHVYAGYRLCESPIETFDPVINNQHLLECLKQLLRAYDSVAVPLRQREQFEALYLLHSLGSPHSVQHALQLPRDLRQSELVQKALAVNFAFRAGNYVRFFRLSFQLPCVLCLCAVHAHFYLVRKHALQVMSVAYSGKMCRYPVAKLSQALGTTRGTLMELAHSAGLVSQDDVVTAQTICFLKQNFTNPTKVVVHKQGEVDSRLHDVEVDHLLLGEDS